MSDPRANRLAHLLVNYCVAVQPGERILVTSALEAQPLARETYREVIRAGGLPLLLWGDDATREILLKEGNDEQLQHVPEPVAYIYRHYDGQIGIGATGNTRTMSGVDPQRQQLRASAFRELNQTMMERSATGDLRWVGTLFPNNAHAQEADMSLSEFEDFVYGACYVDRDDPVGEWRAVSRMQQRLVDWLRGKENVVVTGPNVDLTLSISGRTFINSDGRKNMPSGEIFTSPVETSASGWIRFSYPAIYGGREVEGVELRFEDGKVIDASARKNEVFLRSVLDTDDGARTMAEFAVGTNKGITQFTKSILFDEKIGGTIHIALGSGFPEAGGTSQSAIHWDMICDMRDGGQIVVDGERFYDSGEFTIM